MRFLLDTHALLWYAQGNEALSSRARQRMDKGRCFYSIVSLWEIAIKQTLGKIECHRSIPELADFCEQAGFLRLFITPEHIEGVKGLPAIHGDPFDRLLVSQALAEDLSIITCDRLIPRYPVQTIW